MTFELSQYGELQYGMQSYGRGFRTRMNPKYQEKHIYNRDRRKGKIILQSHNPLC